MVKILMRFMSYFVISAIIVSASVVPFSILPVKGEVEYGLVEENAAITIVEALDTVLGTTYGGMRDQPSSKKFFIFAHALQVLSSLDELENLPSDQQATLLGYTTDLIDFTMRYLKEPYHRDSRGFVNYYDENLGDESYPRASKRAVDQILMALAVTKFVSWLHQDPRVSDLQLAANEAISFLNDYLLDETNFGWFRGATPLTGEEYAIDKTKNIEDLSWITIFFLQMPDTLKEKVGSSALQHIQQMIDFLNNNLKENDGGIGKIATTDGSAIIQTFSGKTNSLFGLANLALYRHTKDSTYLTSARNTFNFLRREFYDLGFGGLFEQVDANRDLSVRSKSSAANLLMTELTCELLAINPENVTLQDTFSRLKLFCQQTFQTSPVLHSLVRTSTDRIGQTIVGISHQPNSIYLWTTISQPHFYKVQYRKTIPIGLPFKAPISFENKFNLDLSIKVQSSAFEDFNLTTTKSHVDLELPLVDTVSPGLHEVIVEIVYKQAVLDQVRFEISVGEINVGGNLIVLVLLGFGVGAIVLIILQRPELLESLFAEITDKKNEPKSESISEETENKNELR